MLKDELLKILVCPATKGPLVYQIERNELWSKDAGLAYPVRDDIPILIAAEARELNNAELQELESA